LWYGDGPGGGPPTQASGSSLADVLERVLDKGIVVAGDVAINLLDIELLTIKLRLLIASADKAKELGIDWWTHDRHLSGGGDELGNGDRPALEERVQQLESQLRSLGQGTGARSGAGTVRQED
jgi:hypothetical protein